MSWSELNGESACRCSDELWTSAGDSCVLKADRDSLNDKGFLGGDVYSRVTYYDMFDAKGENTMMTVSSDVFTQLYLQAGVGCLENKEIQHC